MMNEVRRAIEEAFPGVRFISLPDRDLISQLLKLSEIDKEKDTKHLISLFKTVNPDDKSRLKLCKDFVEDYLSKPYFVYDPKDNHKLITKKDHD